MELRICSVSGGKDSTALYCWMLEQFGKDGFRAVFADTGNEHPVTLNYVRNMAQMAGGPEIEWVKADLTDKLKDRGLEPTDSVFLDLCLFKARVPSTKAQFCTEWLKLRPIRDWLATFREGHDVVIYTVIRRGESAKRSTYLETQYLDFYECWTRRPLIDWTESQVFAYLQEKGVPPNPLYAHGFSRVGCFPCIHARKSELTRLPDWAWDKLEEWEAKIGRTWFSFGTIPFTDAQKLSYRVLPKVCKADASGNNEWMIDPEAEETWKNENSPKVAEVREWAKTSRGGRQFDMFAADAADVPSCMSTWGICE